MATEKQVAANRANARRSTGPKTEAGKRKSSQNAYQHGLSSSELPNSSSTAVVQTIVRALLEERANDQQKVAAQDLAQAQAALLQIQAARAAKWASIDIDKFLEGENAKKLKRLAALDRYERYALTKRRKASKRLSMPQ
jgi:hypothetical protein